MADKNITYFNENDWYESKIRTLDTYTYCRMCIESELRYCKSLLDIGNGGFFNYDISKIERVVALDLFLDEECNYGENVTPVQGNALDFNLDEKHGFDVILLQMLIHHVTGRSPGEAVQNVEAIFSNCAKHLASGGRILVIESTVPAWFYFFEKIAFRLLYRIWNFPHPITFQHTPTELVRAAKRVGLTVEEYTIIPMGAWVILFGIVLPSVLTPVQPIKLVLSKP